MNHGFPELTFVGGIILTPVGYCGHESECMNPEKGLFSSHMDAQVE